MNKLLLFTVGVATGAAVTYVLLKDKLKEEYQMELDSMEEYFQKREDLWQEKLIFDAKEEVEEQKQTYVDYVKKYSPGEIVEARYREDPYPIEEDDPLAYYPEDDPPQPTDEEPEIISEQDFELGFLHFLKDELYYYEMDDLLVTEENEIIEDVIDVVGDALLNFDEDGCVYVRNHKQSTDYMVYLVGDTHFFPIDD